MLLSQKDIITIILGIALNSNTFVYLINDTKLFSCIDGANEVRLKNIFQKFRKFVKQQIAFKL